MVVKVKDGTRGSASLCTTCSNAHIIKGSSDSEERVYCQQNSKFVPFRVVDCNNWTDKSAPSLWDMRQIAWVLSTDKQKHFGFKSPKDWRAERGDDLDDGLDNVPDPRGAR